MKGDKRCVFNSRGLLLGFRRRDVWSLFNSFTEALKTGNLAELPKRTEALHGLLDTRVGLALAC